VVTLLLVPSFDASACIDLLSGWRPTSWEQPNPRGSSPQQEVGVIVTTPQAMSGPFAPEPSRKNPLPPSEQRRRTWLVVLVIILAVILIGIVSCVTLIGTADKAINGGIAKVEQDTSLGDAISASPAK
jgi:hypothetical protein